MAQFDMDINHNFYHEFQSNQQDWVIEHWLRTLKVKARDLQSHPCVDDMITLILIRHELWALMNATERACWGAYWGIVYIKKRNLNQKFWKKFNQITQAIDNRQQLIHRLRAKENMDHDNEAKGSCPPKLNLRINGNNGSAVENSLPWE